MRLVEGDAINWGEVREMLGASSTEVESPLADELAQMLAMAEEPEMAPNASEWQMIDLEDGVAESDAEALAAISALEVRHADFSAVAVGVWNHPLNLSERAVGQILVQLGYPKPEGPTGVSAIGRISGWP